VDHLLELGAPHWVPSVVGRGAYKTNNESVDLQNQQSPNRTSYSCMLRSSQTPMVEAIEQRLAAVAGIDVDFLERLNMVRYEPGQLFNEHHDGRFRPKTVFIYLNDIPEDDGGETYFPRLNVQFRPRKGCAVMWANTLGPQEEDKRMIHQGLPPRTTVKYGVNCFFNERPLRQWIDVDSEDEADVDIKAKAERKVESIDPAQLVENSEEGLVSVLLSENPAVRVVPEALTVQEAAELRAMVIKEGDPPLQQTPAQTALLSRVAARLAAIAGLSQSHMLSFSLSKCEPGVLPVESGEYVEKFGHRVVFVFLNDLAGAELRFPRLRFEVRPRSGCAVVWSPVQDGKEDRRAFHQGRRPKSETRYAAVMTFTESGIAPHQEQKM